MATKVTPELKKRMNELYYQLHTYAAVAREVGLSASTVSKYVDVNWAPVNQENFQRIGFQHMVSPELSLMLFRLYDNYGDMCKLHDEEKEEMKKLWEELEQ